MKYSKTKMLTNCVVATGFWSVGAAAQTIESQPQMLPQMSDAMAVDEIVVTAQKRSESLQKVPLAITAVRSEDLAKSQIRDIQGVVALVPNLNIGQQIGVAKVALRGIGLENIATGAEGSIAFHTDGVFISRPIAALSSFYDVEQVEVLRGPQGTLYGRNATGGSINITTRGASHETSGFLRLTAGNYGYLVAEGALGGSIVPDILAARIAFQGQNREGYGENIVTGNDIDDLNSRALRGSLLFTPTDRLSVDIRADYFSEKDNSGGFHYVGAAGFSAPDVQIPVSGLAYGGTVPGDVRDISNEADPANDIEIWGASAKITYALNDTISLQSLAAYRRTKSTILTELDLTSAPLAPELYFERDRHFSQEFQISGTSDRLNWIIGLFYFHENDEGGARIPLNSYVFGAPAPGDFVVGYFGGGGIKTTAGAVFGQATYAVVDNFRLTLGARYSTEKKTDDDQLVFDAVTPYSLTRPLDFSTLDGLTPFCLTQSKRWNSFTPRVALDYQLTSDVLLYASWSKGFKSGTYNLGGLQPPVDPEKVSAFEAGVKSTLFDRRLRLNVTGFYYDYKDLQIGKVVDQQLRLENAANAEIYGLEVELAARLTDHFKVDANGSWLHARFTDYVSEDPSRAYGDGVTIEPASGNPAFDLGGNSLSQSPDFTFLIGAQYEVSTRIGDFSLRGEVSSRDKVYFTPFNVDYVAQGSFAKANAFLNWTSPSDSWSASLFVKNLTDKTTVANSFIEVSLVGFPVAGFMDPPRTFGASLGYKF